MGSAEGKGLRLLLLEFPSFSWGRPAFARHRRLRLLEWEISAIVQLLSLNRGGNRQLYANVQLLSGREPIIMPSNGSFAVVRVKAALRKSIGAGSQLKSVPQGFKC